MRGATKGQYPPVQPEDFGGGDGGSGKSASQTSTCAGRDQISLDIQEAIREAPKFSHGTKKSSPGSLARQGLLRSIIASNVASPKSGPGAFSKEDPGTSSKEGPGKEEGGNGPRGGSLASTCEPTPRLNLTNSINRPGGGSANIPKWILHPQSHRRALWDMAGLLLVLYDMFSIPFMFFNPPEGGILNVMVWGTRLFWSADMPASLITGFVQSDGNIEMRPRRIVLKYLQTWFVLDAFIVGIDWAELLLRGIFVQFAGFGRASRVIRVLRMIRLLRLVRMREVINQYTERVNSGRVSVLLDICKILAAILSFAHILACLWYFISDTTDSEKTWLVVYGYNIESGATLGERYCMCFHWALAQFAGGMDEVTPKNGSERIFAILVFIMTFMMAAAFISSLTSSMTQLYLISSKRTQQHMILRRYLAQSGISKRLATRVRRNAKHAHTESQRNMSEDSVAMLKFVSDPLRMEIHFELYRDEISVHPFFCLFVREGSQVMRHVCHLAIQFSIVASGDVIFNSGESPSKPKMYFVCWGDLQYTSHTGEKTIIGVGEWLSEAALWTTWVHRGVFMAKTDCWLLLLDVQTFRQVVGQFEVPGVDIDAYELEFLERMERMGSEASDLPFPPEEPEPNGLASVTMQNMMTQRLSRMNVMRRSDSKQRDSTGF